MYIYRMLNALSACMIHINLNMIFYTHVEHSPIKNKLHKVLYRNTHTQTDTQTHTVYLNSTKGHHIQTSLSRINEPSLIYS